jgi:hypothetical protein
MKWEQATGIQPLQFICGHCGHKVASNQGFYAHGHAENYQTFVYICPNCTRPTYSRGRTQVPGVVPGNDVDYLPPDIKSLYNEARKATSVGASTAAVLACRKLLMNIAVAHGAKSGDTFVSYSTMAILSAARRCRRRLKRRGRVAPPAG